MFSCPFASAYGPKFGAIKNAITIAIVKKNVAASPKKNDLVDMILKSSDEKYL